MKQWFANPDPASNNFANVKSGYYRVPWFRRLQTQRLEFYEIKLKQIFNFNSFKNLHKKNKPSFRGLMVMISTPYFI